jgi:hypothetical protein
VRVRVCVCVCVCVCLRAHALSLNLFLLPVFFGCSFVSLSSAPGLSPEIPPVLVVPVVAGPVACTVRARVETGRPRRGPESETCYFCGIVYVWVCGCVCVCVHIVG